MITKTKRIQYGTVIFLAVFVFSSLVFQLSTLNEKAFAATVPTVWTTSALQRIGRTDFPGSTLGANVYAAKNETESFQIAIQAPSGGLTNANVVTANLSGPGGTFSKNNFTLYRENFVNITQASPDWGGSNRPLPAGWQPDALIPFVNPDTGADITGATIDAVPFNQSAGINEVIWVDVSVPANTTAGTYTGNFTVASTQGNVIVPITVNVWNFSLPTQPYEKSAFLIWGSGGAAYEQELLKNKISPSVSTVANENSYISSLGLNARDTHFWSGADMSTCTMSAAPTAAQFQAAASQHPTGLYLYNYTADEIGSCLNLATTMQQWAKNMHQAGIDNLVTMVPPASQSSAFYNDTSGTGRSAVDDWVVLPFQTVDNAAGVNYAKSKGDKIWSYNALTQDGYSPKWLIDYPPINERIQSGFINQSLGFKGILYWKVDQWSISGLSYDPWTNPNNIGWLNSSNYPGDGLMTYDGARVGLPGKYVPSIRLKAMRDGVEDFDYVELLKNAGQSTWALSTIRTIASDFQSWSKDFNQLESVRQQLGDKLSQLNGGIPPSAKYPRDLSLTSLEGLSSISSNQPITAYVLSGSTILSTQPLTPQSGKYTVTFQSSDPQLVDIRVSVAGYLSTKLTAVDSTVNASSTLSVAQLYAGDFNIDNIVNALDYSIMNSHYNQNYSTADINKDNLVNSLDFAILKNNYNKVGQ